MELFIDIPSYKWASKVGVFTSILVSQMGSVSRSRGQAGSF